MTRQWPQSSSPAPTTDRFAATPSAYSGDRPQRAATLLVAALLLVSGCSSDTTPTDANEPRNNPTTTLPAFESPTPGGEVQFDFQPRSGGAGTVVQFVGRCHGTSETGDVAEVGVVSRRDRLTVRQEITVPDQPVDRTGSFRGEFTVPEGLSAELEYKINVACTAGGDSVSASRAEVFDYTPE